MTYSTATFSGQAATPGIFVTVTCVCHGPDHFFSISQTAHRKARSSYAPLNSISYQLNSDLHTYPIRATMEAYGWSLDQCNFRMWLIGRIDEDCACKGLSFDECSLVAIILTSMIRQHLMDQGHEAIGHEPIVAAKSPDKRFVDIATILFQAFLQIIVHSLMDNKTEPQ